MGRYPGAPESDASGSSVVGRGLSIIGRHAYAYSGLVTATTGAEAADTLLLEFTTGDYILDGTLAFCDTVGSNNKIFTLLKLNGINTAALTTTGYYWEHAPRLPLLLPPFTALSFWWGVGNEVSDSGSAIIKAVIHATRDG